MPWSEQLCFTSVGILIKMDHELIGPVGDVAVILKV